MSVEVTGTINSRCSPGASTQHSIALRPVTYAVADRLVAELHADAKSHLSDHPTPWRTPTTPLSPAPDTISGTPEMTAERLFLVTVGEGDL